MNGQIIFMAFLNKKIIGGCALILSGCVSLPKNEQTRSLITPPAIDTCSSLNTPYFSKGDWPEETWWRIFESQQLDSLIAQALSQNPSIQAVEQRVAFAKQTAKVVRAKLFPLVFFDADESWEYLSKNGLYKAFNPSLPLNTNLIDLTLSFNYEFDFWGKNRNLFNAALGRQKAEKAEEAQVKLITTTAVAQAYFALKTNLVKERLLQKLVEVRKGIFDLQTLLQKKALFSKLPPFLSEENVWEAEKDLLSIQDEIATDRHLINILIGSGPDEALEVDELLPSLPKTLTLPNNLSIDLLSRRPDLMAQIWRVEALAHDVGAAKADFYPDINLVGFAGLESAFSFPKLLKGDSKTFGLQPAIHLPVFVAGEIRANIRAQMASFEEAVYEYNNLILRSAQEVADLLVFAQTIFEQKEKQGHIVDNAKQRYSLTALRQLSGLDNQLENYAFQEALIQKEIADIDLLYSQYLAAIKLIKALGGGYSSDYVPLKAQGGG